MLTIVYACLVMMELPLGSTRALATVVTSAPDRGVPSRSISGLAFRRLDGTCQRPTLRMPTCMLASCESVAEEMSSA
jgi:hypothetical protein